MPKDRSAPSVERTNSKYVQPLVVAFLAGIFGFGYSYYSRGELTRALGMGGITWLLIFWVVLRGNQLINKRESKSNVSSSIEGANPFKRQLKWRAIVIVGLLLLGLLITVNYALSPGPRQPALGPPPGYEPKKDDSVSKIRRIHLFFWPKLSEDFDPSFEIEFDSAIADLDIPIIGVEKNWPMGSTVVTYKGIAQDAEKMYRALRSKGIKVSSYLPVYE